ncbi:hypothetical protein SNEBB_000599 [Seison nebaliae]|nr:hypothetical protein SNEBB_000599 [Seison nebaliae]
MGDSEGEYADFQDIGLATTASEFYDQPYLNEDDPYNTNYYTDVFQGLDPSNYDADTGSIQNLPVANEATGYFGQGHAWSFGGGQQPNLIGSSVPGYYGPNRGTVSRNPQLVPQVAAQRLNNFFSTKSRTDSVAFAQFLLSMSNEQRQQVRLLYTQQYGQDPIAAMKKKYKGDTENVLEALMMAPREYEAKELNDAMKGFFSTNEDTLTEILATRTAQEVDEIATAYQRLYGKNLQEQIQKETKGEFEKILLNLLNRGRDKEAMWTNRQLVEQDAQAIAQNLSNKDFLKNQLIEIMSYRSFGHLNDTFRRFREITGQNIVAALLKATKGDYENVLIAIAKCSVSKPRYFAERIAKSMKGFGTNEAAQHRVLVSRSEIDLKDIEKSYEELAGKSLITAMKDENKGDYEEILLEIVKDHQGQGGQGGYGGQDGYGGQGGYGGGQGGYGGSQGGYGGSQGGYGGGQGGYGGYGRGGTEEDKSGSNDEGEQGGYGQGYGSNDGENNSGNTDPYGYGGAYGGTDAYGSTDPYGGTDSNSGVDPYAQYGETSGSVVYDPYGSGTGSGGGETLHHNIIVIDCFHRIVKPDNLGRLWSMRNTPGVGKEYNNRFKDQGLSDITSLVEKSKTTDNFPEWLDNTIMMRSDYKDSCSSALDRVPATSPILKSPTKPSKRKSRAASLARSVAKSLTRSKSKGRKVKRSKSRARSVRSKSKSVRRKKSRARSVRSKPRSVRRKKSRARSVRSRTRSVRRRKSRARSVQSAPRSVRRRRSRARSVQSVPRSIRRKRSRARSKRRAKSLMSFRSRSRTARSRKRGRSRSRIIRRSKSRMSQRSRPRRSRPRRSKSRMSRRSKTRRSKSRVSQRGKTRRSKSKISRRSKTRRSKSRMSRRSKSRRRQAVIKTYSQFSKPRTRRTASKSRRKTTRRTRSAWPKGELTGYTWSAPNRSMMNRSTKKKGPNNLTISFMQPNSGCPKQLICECQPIFK